jgi:lysophospholipase L1-like esterase
VAWSVGVLMVAAVGLASCGPAPGPGRPAPAPGVLGLGDSVMLGASGALRTAIPGIDVDAVVSRQFREAPAIAYWRSQAGTLPGTVVVHLGTNGTVQPGTCDDLMAVLGDRRVIIVDLTVPRSWEAGNNVTLRDCAARNGAAFVDWHAISADRTDLLAGDGFHLNSAGATAYAAAIAGAL